MLYYIREYAPTTHLIQIGSMGEYDPAMGTDIPEGTFDLKMGDSISFNGSSTYHGVLPVTSGIRYALNIWMTETDFDYPKLKSKKSII
jgi:hypothetical protein